MQVKGLQKYKISEALYLLVTSRGQGSNFLKEDIEIIIKESFHIRSA